MFLTPDELLKGIGEKVKEVLTTETKKVCPKCGYVNRKGTKLLHEMKYDRKCEYCNYSWITLD